MDYTVIIIGVLALIVGLQRVDLSSLKTQNNNWKDAEAKANSIIKEAELRAETLKKEKQLEAKEKFVQLKSDYDRDVLERNKKL